MPASYHNHSNWSDGKNSISEIIKHAARLGIDELGISDHYALHPQGTMPKWSMPPQRLGEYIDELLTLKPQANRQGVTLRLGLEVDWFPGHGQAIEAALKPHPLDYIIGSVHEVDGFAIDGSPAKWQSLSEDEINEMNRRYWDHMKTLGDSGIFDIVAHIDLPKKFGFPPTIDLSTEIGIALDAIAASGMVVELNTSGWHKPCADAYPTPAILEACFKRDIPVTLSADAHLGDHLLRDFERGSQRLREAGYAEIARFEGRKIRLESIGN